jgi:hypothetical protein
VVDLTEGQRLARRGRAGHDRQPDEGRDSGPLPDFTGADLARLRALVDHPVLGGVLATLLHRSQAADGGAVAYHEDASGVEQ